MILTIIAFILILGLLIFVHEFGHFIVAKRMGVKVEEFGFGYPPRLFGKKIRGTIYSLNLIPFGGFVKIFGEDGKYKEKKYSFANKKIWQRALMLVAGVAMNFLLAAFALGLGHGLGLPTAIEDGTTGQMRHIRIQVLQVALNSPAKEAGILAGDSILELKEIISQDCSSCGKSLTNRPGQSLKPDSVQDVQNFTQEHQGQKIILILERGKEILEVNLAPRINPPSDEGAMGVALAKTAIVSYPWYLAFLKGFESAFYLLIAIIVAIFGLFWQLIATGRWTGEGGGPIAIYMLTEQMRNLGFIYLLQFTALLSINLAIINGFPFPALDGGRLLFLGIEKIKGKPVSPKIERLVHNIGFAIIIALMLAITWRDIVRWF